MAQQIKRESPTHLPLEPVLQVTPVRKTSVVGGNLAQYAAQAGKDSAAKLGQSPVKKIVEQRNSSTNTLPETMKVQVTQPKYHTKTSSRLASHQSTPQAHSRKDPQSSAAEHPPGPTGSVKQFKARQSPLHPAHRGVAKVLGKKQKEVATLRSTASHRKLAEAQASAEWTNTHNRDLEIVEARFVLTGHEDTTEAGANSSPYKQTLHLLQNAKMQTTNQSTTTLNNQHDSLNTTGTFGRVNRPQVTIQGAQSSIGMTTQLFSKTVTQDKKNKGPKKKIKGQPGVSESYAVSTEKNSDHQFKCVPSVSNLNQVSARDESGLKVNREVLGDEAGGDSKMRSCSDMKSDVFKGLAQNQQLSGKAAQDGREPPQVMTGRATEGASTQQDKGKDLKKPHGVTQATQIHLKKDNQGSPMRDSKTPNSMVSSADQRQSNISDYEDAARQSLPSKLQTLNSSGPLGNREPSVTAQDRQIRTSFSSSLQPANSPPSVASQTQERTQGEGTKRKQSHASSKGSKTSGRLFDKQESRHKSNMSGRQSSIDKQINETPTNELMKHRLLLLASQRIEKELQRRQQVDLLSHERRKSESLALSIVENERASRQRSPLHDSGTVSQMSIQDLRDDNRRRQSQTVSMLEGPCDDVLNSTLHWKERPFKWRKDVNEKVIVADYQQRYTSGQGRAFRSSIREAAESRESGLESGTRSATETMGPFYSKYIKKMGQVHVKDRVKRLKDTFDVVRKGQPGRFATSSLGHNRPLQNKSYPQKSQYDSFMSNAENTLNLQHQQSLSMAPNYGSTPSVQQQEQRRLKATLYSSIKSPLMRKSGFDLRQRLGQGDRTIDQIFPCGDSLRGSTQHMLGDCEESQNYLRSSLYERRSSSQMAPALASSDQNQLDAVGCAGLNSSVETNEGEGVESGAREFKLGDAASKIQVALPSSNRNKALLSKNEKFPTIDGGDSGSLQEISALSAFKKETTLKRDSIQSQEGMDEHEKSEVSLLIKPQHPQVSVTGTRLAQVQRLQQSNQPLDQSLSLFFSSNKALPDAQQHSMSGSGRQQNSKSLALSSRQMAKALKYSQMIAHASNQGVVKASAVNNDLEAFQQQRNGPNYLEVAKGQKSNALTPNARDQDQKLKLDKAKWKQKRVAQERQAAREYGLGSHRNTLQKHVWKQPSVQTETGPQLVNDTLDSFYKPDQKVLAPNDGAESSVRQRQAKKQPVDLAVVKSKAFQQFDFILDAERDIQRQIKTTQQIPFGKEGETPRSQKKFYYSAISSAGRQGQGTDISQQVLAFQPQQYYASSYDKTAFGQVKAGSGEGHRSTLGLTKKHCSQASSLNSKEEAAVNKLSDLLVKQKLEQRKLCQSCLADAPNSAVLKASRTGRAHPNFPSLNRLSPSKDLKISPQRDDQGATRLSIPSNFDHTQHKEWLRGTYHVKLAANLHITQDYALAAQKTQKELFSVSQDRRHRSIGLRASWQGSELPEARNDSGKGIEFEVQVPVSRHKNEPIETYLKGVLMERRRSQKDPHGGTHGRRSKETISDLIESTQTEHEETQMEQHVRSLATKYNQENTRSESPDSIVLQKAPKGVSKLSGTQSDEASNDSNVLYVVEGNLGQTKETPKAHQNFDIAINEPELVHRPSTVKVHEDDSQNDQTRHRQSIAQVQPKPSVKREIVIHEGPSQHGHAHQSLGNRNDCLHTAELTLNDAAVNSAENPHGVSQSLYSIEQKISFLEPEITEQIKDARLSNHKIGIVDQRTDEPANHGSQRLRNENPMGLRKGSTPRRPDAFKSSNAALETPSIMDPALKGEAESKKSGTKTHWNPVDKARTGTAALDDKPSSKEKLFDTRAFEKLKQADGKPDTGLEQEKSTGYFKNSAGDPSNDYYQGVVVGRKQSYGSVTRYLALDQNQSHNKLDPSKSSQMSETATQLQNPKYLGLEGHKLIGVDGGVTFNARAKSLEKLAAAKKKNGKGPVALPSIKQGGVSPKSKLRKHSSKHMVIPQEIPAAQTQTTAVLRQVGMAEAVSAGARNQNTSVPSFSKPTKFSLPRASLKPQVQDQETQSLIVVPQANTKRIMSIQNTSQTDQDCDEVASKLERTQDDHSSRVQKIPRSLNNSSKASSSYDPLAAISKKTTKHFSHSLSRKHPQKSAIVQNYNYQERRLPTRHSSVAWKSPFQAHVERSQAQKHMLEFMVKCQPSEKQRLRSSTTLGGGAAIITDGNEESASSLPRFQQPQSPSPGPLRENSERVSVIRGMPSFKPLEATAQTMGNSRLMSRSDEAIGTTSTEGDQNNNGLRVPNSSRLFSQHEGRESAEVYDSQDSGDRQNVRGVLPQSYHRRHLPNHLNHGQHASPTHGLHSFTSQMHQQAIMVTKIGQRKVSSKGSELGMKSQTPATLVAQKDHSVGYQSQHMHAFQSTLPRKKEANPACQSPNNSIQVEKFGAQQATSLQQPQSSFKPQIKKQQTVQPGRSAADNRSLVSLSQQNLSTEIVGASASGFLANTLYQPTAQELQLQESLGHLVPQEDLDPIIGLNVNTLKSQAELLKHSEEVVPDKLTKSELQEGAANMRDRQHQLQGMQMQEASPLITDSFDDSIRPLAQGPGESPLLKRQEEANLPSSFSKERLGNNHQVGRQTEDNGEGVTWRKAEAEAEAEADLDSQVGSRGADGLQRPKVVGVKRQVVSRR